jgi:hypothetical protein
MQTQQLNSNSQGMDTEAEIPTLCGINRHVQRGLSGWNVRISHRKRIFARYFADKKYGGEQQALDQAKAWRNEIAKRLPKQVFERLCRGQLQHPSSGVKGVTFVMTNSDGRQYSYWQAQWATEEGGAKRKKFSVTKYGYDWALQKAMDCVRLNTQQQI